ncbi:LacI family DNA-binding transcriptional regulator [Ammoniphilus resinae]|uniref:DNA-binding LacI/PurR family transcriptional regulator n=1 Tax=Ammoniphilus resinae TaxID=861532 RepID=A0ABS4GUW0_9BACL|nr:LacI family DNA-binding transcriptional regulator [Ammoniphilus resinae]MBP1934048.1 DNA-binding LacI/PurR family transcriptional regulator [Ammoniphilus resinae]
MVTIKDIAKHAGVSVATVSYVLNNTRYVSPQRRERVLQAVEELNYVPNAVARGLRARNTKTLGLVLSDITNPFFPDLAKGCEDAAQAAGFSLVMLNTNEQRERIINAVLQIREGKVDGLIIASAVKQDLGILQELVLEGYPIVLAHRRIQDLQVDSVVADNFQGVTSAVRYFISLGHTRIAMFTGVDETSVNMERKEGFIKAMTDAGLPIRQEWMCNTLGDYQLAYNASANLMRLPWEERPTAVVCMNDMVALGVMDAVEDRGYQVPADMAVIGFDDLFFAGTQRIQLTSVRIPRYEIGQQAARLIIDRIQRTKTMEPMEIVLPTQLVVRKTSGDGIYR